MNGSNFVQSYCFQTNAIEDLIKEFPPNLQLMQHIFEKIFLKAINQVSSMCLSLMNKIGCQL